MIANVSLASRVAGMLTPLRQGWFYAAQLLLNALSAYAFQKAFAYFYGASVEKTIFDIAFSVPFFLVYASGLGMTHSIVVVLFSRNEGQINPELASKRFSTLLNLSLLVLTSLTVMVSLLVHPLTDLMAPGLGAAHRTQVAQLILALLPLTLTFGVGSFLSAVAVAYRLPLSQEIILLAGRLVVVTWMLMSTDTTTLIQLSIVYVVATMVAVGSLWIGVRQRTPLRYSMSLDLSESEVRHAAQQFAGFMFVAILGQFAGAYTRRVATTIEPALVATIGFASSLLEPIGTILGKSAMYIWRQQLTLTSKTHHSGGGRSEGSILARMFAVAFVGSACLAMVLYLMMPVLVGVLFSGGAFNQEAIQETATIGRLMVAQLPFHIITWLALYPLLSIFRQAAALTYLAGYLGQILFVSIAAPTYGAVGLVLSYPVLTAVQAVFGLALLVWALRHREER